MRSQTRLTSPRFQQLDREPGRAVRRRWPASRFAEGIVVRRARSCAAHLLRGEIRGRKTCREHRHRLLRLGRRQRHRRHRAGQGARRPRPPGALDQHRDAVPARRVPGRACRSTRCTTPTYPLFREPQYLLSLANKIVQVAREFEPRHHPRPLRGSARDGGVPGAAGARVGRRRARRASSRRCTAPTSRWSAATRRTRRSSRSRSSSRTA